MSDPRKMCYLVTLHNRVVFVGIYRDYKMAELIVTRLKNEWPKSIIEIIEVEYKG